MSPKKWFKINRWESFLRAGIRCGVLFSILGFASWFSGIPFLWPSLGPTAYILAFDRDKNHPFKKVFDAHTLGALSGLLGHWIFAPQLTIAIINHPLATPEIKIALSSIVALALTTGLMRATGWTHSPACATTLIVALGLVSGLKGMLYILGAVILIYLTHYATEFLFEKIGWVA